MKYSLTEDGDIVGIRIEGDVLGGPDARTLHDLVRDLIKQNKNRIIFDLSKVELMNSSGLGILIGALTTTREADGNIVLANLTDRIKNLLTITKLNSVFEVFDTHDQAKEHFLQP